MQIAEFIAWIFILAGSFFLISGGLGLLRLPDFFSRMHGASLIDSLGAILIVGGLMFLAGFSLASVKLILLLLFLLVTGPVATHALAKSALLNGTQPLLGKPERKSKK